MRKVLALAFVACTLAGGAAFAGDPVIYDNGDTDGSNGYSNATDVPFGARRTLLDDFTLDNRYFLTDIHWFHIWTSGNTGLGTDAELSIRADAGGSPGAVMHTATSVSYTETVTGRTWFSRPEVEGNYVFQPIELGAGTYWIEMTVVGPENNFWMIRAGVTGSECWINYDDLGGLQPGSALFGSAADLNFRLTGTLVPAPGALALLGLAGVVSRRRRRA